MLNKYYVCLPSQLCSALAPPTAFNTGHQHYDTRLYDSKSLNIQDETKQ